MAQRNKNQKDGRAGRYQDTGKVLFFGAAVGVVAGPLLLRNPTLGMGVGAVIGLAVSSLLSRWKNGTS